MLKNANIFENTPVPKAVAILALPTVLSMLVNVVYNMVDTFFVSKTGDPNQVAAVSIATPVFLLLMAAGNIFGIGGSAFVSRSLGRKEYTLVKKISSFCFYTSIGVGIIMGIIFLLEMPLILKLCGASDNTAGYTKDYLVYIAYGAPFVVVSCAFSKSNYDTFHEYGCGRCCNCNNNRQHLFLCLLPLVSSQKRQQPVVNKS